MADSVLFLFTVSTLTSMVCLIVVFLVSWHYETMFLELATRVSHQEQNIIQFKGTSEVNSVESNTSSSAGSGKGVSFTRWGHGECPQSTELVYSGRMVNLMHSAGSPQCLPIYPSELDRIQRQGVMEKARDYGIPCAVCYSNSHSTVLMQPARETCSNGWSVLYKGLLVTNEASLACMDNTVKSLQESSTKNQYRYVRASCDQLPCPPYDDTSSLTCTVCIK